VAVVVGFHNFSRDTHAEGRRSQFKELPENQC
jgi:hypothetical protein